MYRKILIPTDGSPLSAMAIEKGIGLAKATGAKVVGMTVSVPFHTFALDPMMVSDTKETYKKDCEELAAKYLGAVETAARAAGVPCEVAHVNAEHPYEGIIETAKGRGFDLIFMASHGRKGVSALLAGQRNPQGSDAQQDSRARLPLNGHGPTRSFLHGRRRRRPLPWPPDTMRGSVDGPGGPGRRGPRAATGGKSGCRREAP